MRRSDFALGHKSFQSGNDVIFATLNQQALRRQAPEQVGVGQGIEQRFLLRQIQLGIHIILRASRINAIDSTMSGIAHRGLIRIAFAIFGIQSRVGLARCGVVLNDEIVPVADPNGTIWSRFRSNGARPSIGRVVEIVVQLLGLIRRTFGRDRKSTHQLARAFGHKSILFAILLRETSGGIEAVSRTGGVTLKLVDLTNVG